jgi:hypothetical protein
MSTNKPISSLQPLPGLDVHHLSPTPRNWVASATSPPSYPRKVSFEKGLRYVTENNRRKRALQYFRRFLESYARRWPSTECPEIFGRVLSGFGVAMAACPDSWPLLEALLEDPAKLLFDQWRYGGFLPEELPTLKALYNQWWQEKQNALATKNLFARKEKRPAAKKIA